MNEYLKLNLGGAIGTKPPVEGSHTRVTAKTERVGAAPEAGRAEPAATPVPQEGQRLAGNDRTSERPHRQSRTDPYLRFRGKSKGDIFAAGLRALNPKIVEFVWGLDDSFVFDAKLLRSVAAGAKELPPFGSGRTWAWREWDAPHNELAHLLNRITLSSQFTVPIMFRRAVRRFDALVAGSYPLHTGLLRVAAVIEGIDGMLESIGGAEIEVLDGVPSASAPHNSDDVSRDNRIAREEVERLRSIKRKFAPHNEFVGDSLALLRMFGHLSNLSAQAEKPILILGPSGVGKSKLAELIHQTSARKHKQFEAVSANSAKGADDRITQAIWTGYGKNSGVANANKGGGTGLIDRCSGGTLFIDELHLASPWLLGFLLDLLDGKRVQRAHGEHEGVRPDVRLLLASNWSFKQLEEQKHDLMRRLKRRVLDIPPLSTRPEDVLHMVRAWHPNRKCSDAFLFALLEGDWSGNAGDVKELLEELDATTNAGDVFDLELLKNSLPGGYATVQKLPPQEVRSRLYRRLTSIFERRGLTKKTGLQKEMAQLLNRSAATVSREFRRIESDPRSPQS